MEKVFILPQTDEFIVKMHRPDANNITDPLIPYDASLLIPICLMIIAILFLTFCFYKMCIWFFVKTPTDKMITRPAIEILRPETWRNCTYLSIKDPKPALNRIALNPNSRLSTMINEERPLARGILELEAELMPQVEPKVVDVPFIFSPPNFDVPLFRHADSDITVSDCML